MHFGHLAGVTHCQEVFSLRMWGVSLPLYVAVSMKVLSAHIGSGLQ